MRTQSQSSGGRTASIASWKDSESFPDQSYLAYLRPTPRPFLRFCSGHFPPGTQTAPHSHSCHALHGCLQGPLLMITSQGEHFLDAGVFYLLAPGVRHYWRNTGNRTAATLGLLLDTQNPGRWPSAVEVDACCRKISDFKDGLIRFATAGDQELHRTFWLSADHLTAEESRAAASITGNLLVLLGQVADRLTVRSAAELQPTETAQRIRRVLLARVQDRLSLGEITREIGVSPTRAKELFREAFGCGIMAYFNQLKIWQSKRLLSDRTLSIDQVSQHLGFASASYFTRVFTKHTGETPSEFRRSVGL